MAITVEDGTGLEAANSYVDVAFADAYFLERGIAEWTGMDAVKEVALIKATDYADLRWGPHLRGRIGTSKQALQFPRRYMNDNRGRQVDGVPINWKRAVCEYALSSLSTDLVPTPDTDTGPKLASTKVVVGPITTQESYMPGASAPTFIAYPKADTLARQYTQSARTVIRN